MPRYVILEHDHPFLHWDLMLEAGPVLRTWRLLQMPQKGICVAAVPSFDHRLIYLDYEGPLSGNRGQVIRWDWGEYIIDVESADSIRLRFTGAKLQGVGALR